MVYQLAKTSPLISGQIKCVFKIDGNKVDNIQFVPISDSIPFAYNNPSDTMNYTYMENIKMLYNKISDKFWSAVGKKSLSTDTLYYSKQLYHDTHDNTYERGMKRLPLSRYGKQFEFFCPIWCDNIDDFSKLRFKINIEHPLKGRKLISQFIDTSNVINYFVKHLEQIGLTQTNTIATKEIDNIRYKFVGKADADHDEYVPVNSEYGIYGLKRVYIMPDNTVWRLTSDRYINTYAITGFLARDINIHANENTEMIYFDFSSQRSWVKGINAEAGIIQICDDSYTLENITSRERPLLEFDNMIANMFSKNKLVCSQLFNFDFVFNIEDFLPIEFVNSMIGEKINVYIDVYKQEYDVDKEKNIFKKVEYKDLYSNYDYIPRYDTFTSTNSNVNALDYMRDNRAIEIIDKNKLVQSTFHWAFQNNNSLEFNLYNGLSPVFNKETKRVGFMGDFPNIFANEFVEYDNPLSVMKYTKAHISNPKDITKTIDEILNDDNKFYSYNLNNTTDEYVWFGNIRINNYNFKKGNYTYNSSASCGGVGTSIFDNNVKYGILDLTKKYRDIYENIYKEFKITHSGYDIYVGKTNSPSYKNAFIIEHDEKFLLVIFGYENDLIQKLYFKNIVFNNDFISSFLKYSNSCCFYKYEGNDHLIIPYNDTSDTKLAMFKNILTYTEEPTLITTEGTVSSVSAKHPDKYVTSEVSLIKNETPINMFRYDMNIYPMFIDVNNIGNTTYANNVYWQKQYIGSLINDDNSFDNITDFNIKSFTNFPPKYPSIDYFVLCNTPLECNKFYTDAIGISYNGEKSWYDNNSLFILPTNVSCEYIAENITESNIMALLYNNVFSNIEIESDITDNVKRKIFDEFIYPLYDVTYKYDYIYYDDIKNYKYIITYTLK